MAKKGTTRRRVKAVAEVEPDLVVETQQMLAGDMFPERDDDLEHLVLKLNQAIAAKHTAADKYTVACDSLKESMRDKGLDEYYCYTQRLRVKLQPEDAKIKVEKVKVDESTPFTPSAS